MLRSYKTLNLKLVDSLPNFVVSDLTTFKVHPSLYTTQKSLYSTHQRSNQDQERYSWEMQNRNCCCKPGNLTVTFVESRGSQSIKRFNCKRKRSLLLKYPNLWITFKLTLNLTIINLNLKLLLLLHILTPRHLNLVSNYPYHLH